MRGWRAVEIRVYFQKAPEKWPVCMAFDRIAAKLFRFSDTSITLYHTVYLVSGDAVSCFHFLRVLFYVPTVKLVCCFPTTSCYCKCDLYLARLSRFHLYISKRKSNRVGLLVWRESHMIIPYIPYIYCTFHKYSSKRLLTKQVTRTTALALIRQKWYWVKTLELLNFCITFLSQWFHYLEKLNVAGIFVAFEKHFLIVHIQNFRVEISKSGIWFFSSSASAKTFKLSRGLVASGTVSYARTVIWAAFGAPTRWLKQPEVPSFAATTVLFLGRNEISTFHRTWKTTFKWFCSVEVSGSTTLIVQQPIPRHFNCAKSHLRNVAHRKLSTISDFVTMTISLVR